VPLFSRAGRRRRLWCAGFAAAQLLVSALIVAQRTVEPALKAAFLYNFVKFAEWPAEALPSEGAIRLCVLGDEAVGTALEQTVKDRQVDGHALTVARVNVDGALSSCHVLYVTGLDRRRSMQLIERVKGAPVFTVSDLDGFAALGGVAQLFVENGKMRFALNPASAQRAGLRISSKLRTLGKEVKDETPATP
jgi:hypothetical protein